MQKDDLFAEIVSEYFGTLILILFGAGVCAMTTLFATGQPGEVVMGGWTNINLGWGLGVTFGIYAGKRSGAHLNPAVTLALAACAGFSWRRVIPYCAAQMAGAFTAAALVFLNYRPMFERFDPTLEKTAGIFTTFPATPEAPMYGLIDQILGTALLLFLIMAVVEHAPDWLQPILVGLIVVAIGISFGMMHGYAINPARDLGPRLFIVLAGFPNNGLTDGTNVFWVPIVGPLIGGPLGALLYVKCLKPGLASAS
jgi:glycerol uptake facilitator protein